MRAFSEQQLGGRVPVTEILFCGVLAAHAGRGLGGHLLTCAGERAKEREILTDLVADPDDPTLDLLVRHRAVMREWFERSGDHEGQRDYVVP